LLERNDFDAEFLAVCFNGVLSIIGAVKILASAVFAGPSVVAADDEVRGAVVFADDGVPDCFSGSTHAHGEREKAEYCHAIWVAGEESLVDADTGEMVNITWFREADYGVDEDICLASASSADSQFSVSAVHGVAGLEGNDARPAEFLEVDAKLGGGVAKSDVVIVVEAANSGQLATNIVFFDGVVEVFNCWVLGVAAEYFFGFLLSV